MVAERENALRTFDQMHDDCGSCAYWGERGSWYVVAGQSRDSDALEESNFRSILAKLGGESDTVAVESESHWAVGWIEHLLVHLDDSERVKLATTIREELEGYPVVDEEDFSDLENERYTEYAKGELARLGDDWDTVLREVEEENGSGGPGDECWEAKVIELARHRMTVVGRVRAALAKTDDSVADVIDGVLGVLVEMADSESSDALKGNNPAEMNRWADIAHKLASLRNDLA